MVIFIIFFNIKLCEFLIKYNDFIIKFNEEKMCEISGGYFCLCVCLS